MSTYQVTEKNKTNIYARNRFRIILVGFIICCGLIFGGFCIRNSAEIKQILKHESNNDKHVSVLLEHNNIYEDGIDGILSDIQEKIDLPAHLMLRTSFNLHFSPDGTITSFDTMWYGYDERFTYVDSFLITYDRTKSKKMTIYFDGGTNDPYNAEKDVNVLFDALRLIPLEESVSNWQESEYGILYYGIREWGYDATGIVYLDKKGNMDLPYKELKEEIVGPTVSVFCPQNDSITPIRYVLCEDNMKELNVK